MHYHKRQLRTHEDVFIYCLRDMHVVPSIGRIGGKLAGENQLMEYMSTHRIATWKFKVVSMQKLCRLYELLKVQIMARNILDAAIRGKPFTVPLEVQ